MIGSMLDPVYEAGELALMDSIATTQHNSPGEGPVRRGRSIVHTAGSAGRFAGEANSKLREWLNKEVTQPRLERYHDEEGRAFKDRWDNDTVRPW